MDIDQLLKSKSSKEKMNFLNAIRSKVTAKLKTTDEYKISEALLLVSEFVNTTDVDQIFLQKIEDKPTKSVKIDKSTVVLPTEILGQGVDQIPLQKYDVIKAKIGPCEHYGVIYKIDAELNIAWIVNITSDITLDNLIPIKRSRIFKTFFCAYFHPIFLNKNSYTFCNTFDNKQEFDEVIRIIKRYYKENFRV